MKLMDLKVGDLDQRLTLRSNTGTQDSYGGISDAWTDGVVFRAQVQPAAGTETTDDNLELFKQAYNVMCRYRPAITVHHRITWRNVEYMIEAVTHQKRGGTTTFTMRIYGET